MGIRTIRMDDDAERLLSRIVQTTGMSISAAFKEGLKVFQGELGKDRSRSPFDIYRDLDLGPGGYVKNYSSVTKRAVKEAIQRKLRR